MARQNSPFASMTQQERLDKWMEFQSIRLPYAEGSVDGDEEEAVPSQSKTETRPERPRPPMNRSIPEEQHMIPRHKQYDAVIERMRLASQKAAQFHSAES